MDDEDGSGRRRRSVESQNVEDIQGIDKSETLVIIEKRRGRKVGVIYIVTSRVQR